MRTPVVLKTTPDHALLRHPRVLVTAHSASASRPDEAARQMIRAARAHRDGHPIDDLVDRTRGF